MNWKKTKDCNLNNDKDDDRDSYGEDGDDNKHIDKNKINKLHLSKKKKNNRNKKILL